MKILGPTETGKGILIEMDAGYVSPSHEFNKKMLEENHKNFLDYSKPFEFYAVLQKYNTPNRNGRVYPERILKRESENYKKMIQKGTSLSELNHPESSLIDSFGMRLLIIKKGLFLTHLIPLSNDFLSFVCSLIYSKKFRPNPVNTISGLIYAILIA